MNSPHLDDERLSAHLDGSQFDDTDPAAADHLAQCASCRARLESFRSVASLVGAPVAPPSAGAVDAAVAAALAVHASPGGSPVVPLSTAVRRRRTQVGLAAAAAVVTVVLGITTLGGGGGDDGQTAAIGDGSESSATGPDLGDQSDARALADRVRTAVEGEPLVAMAPTADSTEADDAQASGGGSAAPSGSEAAPAPQGEAAVTSKRAVAARSSIRPTGPCTATARSEYGRGLADLVFQGTLRWEGTPAVVLAYRIEGATGALDHRVLVLAREDCRLLVAQTI